MVQDESDVYLPTSLADSNRLMDALESREWWKISPRSEEEAGAVGRASLSSVDFGEQVVTIVKRSQELTQGQFAEELAEKGLLVRGDFGDKEWPPKRFDD